MTKKYENLFSPITIGSMKLKNRIVLAPMSVHITPPDGSITDREILFYKTALKLHAALGAADDLEDSVHRLRHATQEEGLGLCTI